MRKNYFLICLGFICLSVALISALLLHPFVIARQFQVIEVELALTIWEEAGASQRRLITVPTNQAGPFALALINHGGVARLQNDGVPVVARAETANFSVDRYRRITAFDLPTPVGINRTISITTAEDRLPAGLGSAYLAPKPVIDRLVTSVWHTKHIVGLAMPLAALCCLLVSFGLVYFSNTPQRYGYIICTFICNLIIENDSRLFINNHPISLFESYFGTALVMFVGLALAEWWERPNREKRIVVLIAAATIVGLVIADLTFGIGSDKTAKIRTAAFVLPAFASVVYWLWLVIAQHRIGSTAIQTATAFTSAVLIAFLTNLIRLYVTLDGWQYFAVTYFTKLLGATAIIGLCVGALAHELSEYRARRRTVGTLEQIVSGGNLAMEGAAKELQQEIQHRAVLEERQRFVRDMHDGIGGQLLSVLVKLRRGEAPHQELALEVQSAIAELRLITAAMDSDVPGLGGALIALRGRLQNQAQAANVRLEWSAMPDLGTDEMDSRKIIEILRIIQEAAANAMGHAQASRVAIDVEGQNPVRITVTDDGCGFETEHVIAGNGLRNMHRRAKKIGGTIAIESAPGNGTILVLTVPTELSGW